MKKQNVIIIVFVALIALIGGILLFALRGGKVVSLNTTEEMSKLIDDIYKKTGFEMAALTTTEIDITDEAVLSSYTGLSSSNNIEKVVVSESMMTSQAYSLVLVKVKDGANIESIKKEIYDNIDMRKWICVTADVLYVNNHEDVIFVVMGETEAAKKQYDEFRNIVGKNTGKLLTKKSEE